MLEDKKKVLYLGLNPSKKSYFHFPIIKIHPLKVDESLFFTHPTWTHLLFTSQVAVTLFFDWFEKLSLPLHHLSQKCFIAVGSQTKLKILDKGAFHTLQAKEETAEGVVELLKSLDLKKATLFFPHSSKSRKTLFDYLSFAKVSYQSIALYEPVTNFSSPPPPLNDFDEIIFTAPSTVDAFLDIYHFLPDDKILTSIGPVTQKYLDKKKRMN